MRTFLFLAAILAPLPVFAQLQGPTETVVDGVGTLGIDSEHDVFYKLNETTGTTADDGQGPTAWDGTVSGTHTWTTGGLSAETESGNGHLVFGSTTAAKIETSFDEDLDGFDWMIFGSFELEVQDILDHGTVEERLVTSGLYYFRYYTFTIYEKDVEITFAYTTGLYLESNDQIIIGLTDLDIEVDGETLIAALSAAPDDVYAVVIQWDDSEEEFLAVVNGDVASGVPFTMPTGALDAEAVWANGFVGGLDNLVIGHDNDLLSEFECKQLTASVHEGYPFTRGDFYCDNDPGTANDSNRDGGIDNDTAALFEYLFGTGVAPDCLEAADADNNGSIGLNDTLVLAQEEIRWLAADPALLAFPNYNDQCSYEMDYVRDSLTCGRDTQSSSGFTDCGPFTSP